MNPQYAALRALGIPAGHHDATRFVYFWAPPKGEKTHAHKEAAAYFHDGTLSRLKMGFAPLPLCEPHFDAGQTCGSGN
jgi:hypothetical protein